MNDKTWRSRNAPLTEEQLRAVTVGEVAPLNGTIPLEPYNLEWPAMYARLGKQIRDVLGAKVLLLEHVGSTSIPGLSAKPIIDMVLAVEDSADEISYVPPLVAAGYVLRIREPEWFEHRLLKSPSSMGIFMCFPRDARRSTACWRFASGCGQAMRTGNFTNARNTNGPLEAGNTYRTTPTQNRMW
ncbi:MAG: GrpB family protein [Rhodoplanes sp.]